MGATVVVALVLTTVNVALTVAVARRVNDQDHRLAALEHLLRGPHDPLLDAVVGRPVPSFDVPTTRGDRVSDASLRGDGAAVAFLSPACPACEGEADALVQAAKGDLLPPTVAVVRRDGDASAEAAMVDRLAEACTVVVDEDGSLAAAFGVSVSPAILAVDGNGVVTAASVSTRELLPMPG
jgi:peroxiredoxin